MVSTANTGLGSSKSLIFGSFFLSHFGGYKNPYYICQYLVEVFYFC